MNDVQHWDYSLTAGHETHGQSAVYDASGKDIAIVYDGDAHAALIAAAPDLLKACHAVLDAIGEEETRKTSPTWYEAKRSALRHQLRTAIDRATNQPAPVPQEA